MQSSLLVYAGFWRRAVATLLDGLLFSGITALIMYLLYGPAYFTWAFNDDGIFSYYTPLASFIDWGLPLAATIVIWVKMKGTPSGQHWLRGLGTATPPTSISPCFLTTSAACGFRMGLV